jgi:membrane-associated HD superfamily phosphohydrolase
MNRQLGLSYLTCSAIGTEIISLVVPQDRLGIYLSIAVAIVLLLLFKNRQSRVFFSMMYVAAGLFSLFLGHGYYVNGAVNSQGMAYFFAASVLLIAGVGRLYFLEARSNNSFKPNTLRGGNLPR